MARNQFLDLLIKNIKAKLCTKWPFHHGKVRPNIVLLTKYEVWLNSKRESRVELVTIRVCGASLQSSASGRKKIRDR